MGEVAQLLTALVAYLAASGPVAAMAGNRVFALGLSEAEVLNQPRQSVNITLAPNVGFVSSPTFIEDAAVIGLDVWCYGATELEAVALYGEVHRVLKRLNRVEQSGVLIHGMTPVTSPRFLVDPDFDGPVVIETWSVLAAEGATV